MRRNPSGGQGKKQVSGTPDKAEPAGNGRYIMDFNEAKELCEVATSQSGRKVIIVQNDIGQYVAKVMTKNLSILGWQVSRNTYATSEEFKLPMRYKSFDKIPHAYVSGTNWNPVDCSGWDIDGIADSF
jgi:hypothetical protein